jgi:hypothetical protein
MAFRMIDFGSDKILNFSAIECFDHNSNSSRVVGEQTTPNNNVRVRSHSQMEESMESAVYEIDVFWVEDTSNIALIVSHTLD